MNVVLVVLSFLVGAVIAWATRPRRRTVTSASEKPPRVVVAAAREKQEEHEREEEEGEEEAPLYAPYAVSRRESPPAPSDGGEFVSAPLLLPVPSSAPPSPRAGRVPWEPDDSRPDCTFCRARFSFGRRRHHCRSCGLLVCGSCSRDRARVPGHGALPVRVCDGCKITSIASRKGEAMPLQSIKAFALQSSGKTARAGPEERRLPEREAPEEEDAELLRMAQLLSADLSHSLVKPEKEAERQQEEDEEGEDESRDERRPVKRALFEEIPPQYRWRDRLREAEQMAQAADEAPEVLRQGEIAVRRIAASPVDAFCLYAPLPEGVSLERVAEGLLDLPDRLVWDNDLSPDGSEELKRFGSSGSLQRHVTKPVGPISARSFVVLLVRCDEGSVVRLMQTGVNEPELHDARATAGGQLPQLLTLERRGSRVWMRQTVHLQLGGWLPMGVVLSGMPALLANSCSQWLAHIARTCGE